MACHVVLSASVKPALGTATTGIPILYPQQDSLPQNSLQVVNEARFGPFVD